MLTDEEIIRYSRQLVLPEVGGEGQERLRRAAVLVVGAGGLGSPAALYLAAAGVGRLGLADGDRVDLSNLQRQILHFTPDVGRPKARSGREKLLLLNPAVSVRAYEARLDGRNARELVAGYDAVVAAVDNVESRYILNDACVAAGVPMVEAGILGFRGLLMTVIPGRGPCYRCVFPEPPPPGSVPTCAEAGVIGALAGVMGSLQALEAIKIILGRGSTYTGRLLVVDALAGRFREVPWRGDPRCPACGAAGGHGAAGGPRRGAAVEARGGDVLGES